MATNILMPALSPTMEEGKLAKWLVKEGDIVKSGTILAEIETDKATMEFEAVDEGKIGKILVAEGSEGVKVNAPIAILLEEGEKLGAAPAPKAPSNGDIAGAMKDIGAAVKAEVAPAEEKKKPLPEAAKAASTLPQGEGGRVFASPLAKRIAATKGIDISALSGTGPRGRIVKSDVENAPAAEPPIKQLLVRPRRLLPALRLPLVPVSPVSRRCQMRGCSMPRAATRKCRTIPCARRSPSA